MDTLQTISNWAQIIALPVSIIAIVVSISLYHRARYPAGLTCVFDCPQRPVEIKAGPDLVGDIEIRYRGQTVDNLYLARATIRNSGSVPIRGSDIHRPLAFTFTPEAKLLGQPRIADPCPADLRFDLSIVETSDVPPRPSATVRFDLLNPGDHFTVEFIYTGLRSLPGVSSHIAGAQMKVLTDLEFIDPKYSGRLLRSTLIGVLGLSVGIWLESLGRDSGFDFLKCVGSCSVLFATFLLVWTVAVIIIRRYSAT